jgi:hypothetical protein
LKKKVVKSKKYGVSRRTEFKPWLCSLHPFIPDTPSRVVSSINTENGKKSLYI